jgi:hypothetical protein
MIAFGIFLWRFLLQKRCDACHTVFFQWYFLATCAIFFGLLRAFVNLLEYDFLKDAFTDLPSVIKWPAMVVPVIGGLESVVCLGHAILYARARRNEKLSEAETVQTGTDIVQKASKVVSVTPNVIGNATKQRDIEKGSPVASQGEDTSGGFGCFRRGWKRLNNDILNPWAMDDSDELTLLVILMPAFLIVMAIFAEIRILEVILGSTFVKGGENWDDYATWRLSTQTTDLACGSAFQCVTVLAFARLCVRSFGLDDLVYRVGSMEKELAIEYGSSCSHEQAGKGTCTQSSLREILEKTNDEHKHALERVGLQGIWAYVIVGLLRSTFAMLTAAALELKMTHMPPPVEWLVVDANPQKAWLLFNEKCHLMFVFASILCFCNWSQVQKLHDLKHSEALGNAALKFMGVRVLLFVGEGQKWLLHSGLVGHWSSSHADLLHVSLLMLWCLFVIVWNLVQI